MNRVITFTDHGPCGPDQRREQAAARAMRRYIPHVVAWQCAGASAPIAVTLPETLSVRDLLRRAERERVRVDPVHDPAAPDRVFHIHYAHLAEAEIEEGIRRLGRCLQQYAKVAAGESHAFVGT